MNKTQPNIYIPHHAKIIKRTQEAPNIFTLGIKFTTPNIHNDFRFKPGQFNMLYCYGVGEIPISIVSDPEDHDLYVHTIRSVGRVSKSLSLHKEGHSIGVRGPFGNGWPVKGCKNCDVIIITGGLGCASSVAMINTIIKHRDQYGHLTILQGVKHSDDLIFKQHYEYWNTLPNTDVLLAADKSTPQWPWHTGYVTELIDQIKISDNKTLCMLCGPELMIAASIKKLLEKELPEENIYLNLERNMECAVGHCGHCQMGNQFICKNGPVLRYPDIKHWFRRKGF